MPNFARAGGLFLAGALLTAAAAAGGESKEFRKTLPLDRDGVLSIDTYKGSITVLAAEAAEASIEARIEPDGDDADQAKKVQATEIVVRGGGGSISVETDYSRVRRGGFLRLFSEGSLPLVHYTIRMPPTARLQIDDYKSAIRVTGRKAAVKIDTYKGTVDIADQDGGIEIDTYKGDVSVAYARFAKPAAFETYKGEIRLRLPAASGFELDADMGKRGDLETDFEVAAASGSREDGERFHGPVGGGGPKLKFRTTKGSLSLRRG
jgi:hypothetical protein